MTNVETFLKEIDWAKWQSSHRLFAVVDCAQIDDEQLWRKVQNVDKSVRCSLFEGTDDEGLSNVEPVLLDVLNPAIPHILSWLVEQEKKQHLNVWFASTQSFDVLKQHLKQLLVVDLPDAPDALLRFYDPSVFAKLMTVMHASQRARFFTHIDKWWAWSTRKVGRYTFNKKDASEVTSELVLSQKQMDQLSQMDVEDFLYDTKTELIKNKNDLKYVHTINEELLINHLKNHVEKALTFGFETEEGIKTYLLCVAKKLGWSFEENNDHPKALSTLQNKNVNEDTKLEQLQIYCETV